MLFSRDKPCHPFKREKIYNFLLFSIKYEGSQRIQNLEMDLVIKFIKDCTTLLRNDGSLLRPKSGVIHRNENLTWQQVGPLLCAHSHGISL